jgi:phosphoribosyl 1,2-cyclic phosphodiesterase
MRFLTLASGSSGNASAVWRDGRGLLIDAGFSSSKALEAALRAASLRPEDVAGILVTHAHSDHFGNAARILARKFRIPVLTHEHTWRAACRRARDLSLLASLGLLRFLTEDADHLHDHFQIRTHSVPHGGEEAGRPLAFLIRSGGKALFYSTDLGSVPPYLIPAMREADFVMLESNYDEEMERASNRPDCLKAWVMGPTGHLSNVQAAEALRAVFEPGHKRYPRRVVLGHLSEECNEPELALAAARECVPADVEVHVAARHEASVVWEI